MLLSIVMNANIVIVLGVKGFKGVRGMCISRIIFALVCASLCAQDLFNGYF